ncbi:MAG: type II toxin-antitoxin system Phd/YefM family antitoxin [Solirubrobacterales bacterium]
MTEISASAFKARCLALLDEVAESGAELVITKRGKAVAQVVPVDEDASLEGSVRQLVDDDELVEPIDAEWTAAGPPAA